MRIERARRSTSFSTGGRGTGGGARCPWRRSGGVETGEALPPAPTISAGGNTYWSARAPGGPVTDNAPSAGTHHARCPLPCDSRQARGQAPSWGTRDTGAEGQERGDE